MRVIKSIWVEALRILPVQGTEMQLAVIDHKRLVGFDMQVADFHVFLKVRWRSGRSDWVNAKNLLDHIAEIRKVLAGL